jgi:hypothetical protein
MQNRQPAGLVRRAPEPESRPETILFIDTAGNRRWERDASITNRPYLVRVVAALVRQGMTIEIGAETFAAMVSLPVGQTIRPDGTEQNGIVQSDMRSWPDDTVSARYAIRRIHEMAEKSDMMVAHSIDFHAGLLRLTADRVDQTLLMPQAFCTMRNSTAIVRLTQERGNGLKWPKLSEAYEFFAKRKFPRIPDDPLRQGRTNLMAVTTVFDGISKERSR